MSNTYHVASPDGTRYGQMTVEEITTKINSGELPADSLVWAEGWEDWQPAKPVCPPPVQQAPWGLVSATLSVYRHRYMNFSGRASRAEFWYSTLGACLATVAITFCGGMADGLLGTDFLAGLLLIGLMLYAIIPGIALCVRRLHDVDMSGWWYLLSFLPMGHLFLFIIALLPSGGPNRWGTRPDGPIE